MLARIAAEAVMLLHFAFILFAIFGSFGALRWPRLVWLHLPCLAWAVWIALSGSYCPLTPLEVDLRIRAGESGYSGGFIDHYLARWIYPEGLTRQHQVLLGVALVAINATGYAIAMRRKRRKSLIPEKVA